MVATRGFTLGASMLVALSLHGCSKDQRSMKITCPAKPELQSALVDGHGPVRAALGSWIRVAQPGSDVPHEVTFVVKQENMAQLHDMFMERSNPRSPSYGTWLSAQALRDLTQNEAALTAVKQTLQQNGAEIVRTTKGGEMIRARAPIRVWERFLATTFHTFASSQHNSSRVAAETFSIPESIGEHVMAVLGVTDLPSASKFSVSASSSSGKLDPQTIRKAYDLPEVASDGSPEAENRKNVTQAVYASLQQYWSPSDREQFQEMYSLTKRPVTELDNGTHSSDIACQTNPNDCVEANLDVEYMLAMSPWSQMGFWYSDDQHGTFLPFLEELHDTEDPPEVISISYGSMELSQDPGTIKLFDTMAQKLALMGVTLIAASGDDGGAGSSGSWRDGNAGCADTDRFGLPVNWPASSQYVTAVGATQGVESGIEETTCQIKCAQMSDRQCSVEQGPAITSGGGISAFTERPSWQDGSNPCDRRGIPDVSLAGHSYNIIVGGQQMGVDGTSASAPVFGGLVSLVNARRKAAGKSTVGFINQAMYQNPSAFNDITKGDNKCGGSSSQDRSTGLIPCCGGYDAVKGWDAATGLGSVNFPKFEAIFEGDLPPVPPTPPVPPPTPAPQTSPAPSGKHHYGAPPCMSDEMEFALQQAAVASRVCAPPCSSGSCTVDVDPSCTDPRPLCALQDQQGGQYCALVCGVTGGNCPSGAVCTLLDGVTGVCVYPGAGANATAHFSIKVEITV